jgi:hypothetical protein
MAGTHSFNGSNPHVPDPRVPDSGGPDSRVETWASATSAHLATCAVCAGAVTTLEGPLPDVAPPPELRQSVLTAAVSRRRPASSSITMVTRPYGVQVAVLDELLGELSAPEWDAPVERHDTVRGLLTHLTANDAAVAGAVGVGTEVTGTGPRSSHARWRRQATSLLERLSGSEDDLLGLRVSLAGTRPMSGSLRDAMVQRAFETWTHVDDIRAALHHLGRRPTGPPPEPHVRLIADFGLSMLGVAMKALGTDRPGVSAHVVLTGHGGGEWTVPLSPDLPLDGRRGEVGVELSADAVDFCRLLAGRNDAATFSHTAQGDPMLVREILRAAATLGCD